MRGPHRLKLPGIQSPLRTRYALAAAAGVTWTLSFPNTNLAGLAWVAPGFMLMSALGCRGREAFRIGYVAGLVHYLISLHWLLFIPFPAGAVAGWLALSAYLALYPALWIRLSWHLLPGRAASSDPSGNPFELIARFLSVSIFQRLLWAFLCAAVWAALEVVQGRFLTGFPWNFLGVSQFQILPLIQITSVTGIYGLSFLIAWFSVALACSALGLVAHPRTVRLWSGDLTPPLLAVAVCAAWGVRQIGPGPITDRTLTVALVQPSIPQTLIWDPKENTHRFRQLLQLSEQALIHQPDLLVWPEAALPNMLRHDADTLAAVRKLVTDHRVWLILGADDAAPRTPSVPGEKYDFFNSSFLISPGGEIAATYRKQRLVIFGEYIPWVRWLPFLKHLAPIGDGFTPGDRPVSFRTPEPKFTTSVLICFEDAFPHLARHHVEADTDFLLNLTNDGWFGQSAAQWQHAANAVFRAVENRLPLVRCANNGLTCWIDALGGLHELYFQNSPNIHQPGIKTAKIPLLAAGQERSPTFYRRYGDWFGWLCVGLTVGRWLIYQISSRRPEPSDSTP